MVASRAVVTIELVLSGTRVARPDGAGPCFRPGAVLMADGRIVDVVDPGEAPADAPTRDLGDLLVLPGLVDTHVHLNEPGRTAWEGFASATRAAAVGGVTTLVDMPLNSIPPTTTLAGLQAKRAAAHGHCHVDVAFWGGVVPGNAADLPALIDAGVAGFKAFLIDSGVEEFAHVDAGDLERALPVLAEAGRPLLAHAELPGPIAAAALGLPPPGDRAHARHATWLASRPAAAEDEAVALLVELCRRTGAPVHVVHHCSASSLDTLRRARDEQLALTAETCPHYLHFAAEDIPDGATQYKCAPPIRERDNREQLWEALADGVLDAVVSDHSPCTPQLKQGDFEAAWGGIAGLQLGLPALWHEMRARGHGPERLLQWMAAAPAKLAGLDDRKGRLAPGFDADVVAFDPDARWTLEPGVLHHRHALTPWTGEPMAGRVVATWLRGVQVAADGQPLGDPRGRLLRRTN